MELYSGHETMIASSEWEQLLELGVLPTNEFSASFARLHSAATLHKTLYGSNFTDAFIWENGVTEAQYASFGAAQSGKAIILWTADEAYRPYYVKRPTALTQALFDGGIIAVADFGMTALLPEPLLPEQCEDVEYVIELKISGVPDDTEYYYSDTKELADDVTVIKTRVTCLIKQLFRGEWKQIYDVGYAEGELPSFDFYSTKLVVGYIPSDAQVLRLISDAAQHLPG